MSILNEIILRYRGGGHLRFDLPAMLCEPAKADDLSRSLRRQEGIYRVDIFPQQRKLSIRYLPALLDFRDVIRALAATIETQARTTSTSAVRPRLSSLHTGPWLQRLKNSRPLRWLREKSQEARETATALKIVAKRGLRISAHRFEGEDIVITFLNDVLLLYLLKVHWTLITRYWLRRPFEYRYQWLATFYLVFLLVRSRRPRNL